MLHPHSINKHTSTWNINQNVFFFFENNKIDKNTKNEKQNLKTTTQKTDQTKVWQNFRD